MVRTGQKINFSIKTRIDYRKNVVAIKEVRIYGMWI